MVIQVPSGSILTETVVESSSMKTSQKYIIDFITFFLAKILHWFNLRRILGLFPFLQLIVRQASQRLG